ncbi:hypothetical protein KEJ39_00345 [Candidatus Bathyarchaeota archaeon]|nr:hypothetical protein [Candidatus Bathyarchaeota archaeon]
MARVSIFEFAFALSVVGALVLIIINILLLLEISDFVVPFYMLVPSRYLFPLVAGMSGDMAINIVCGFIALLASRRIDMTAWAVVLIALGVVAGGIGGTLVLLGGILALVGRFT